LNRILTNLILAALLVETSVSARGAFDLVVNVLPSGSFTAEQHAELMSATAWAEALWESVIIGYQPGINLTGVTINVFAGSGFAETNYPLTEVHAGYTLPTFTSILVNPTVIDNYASWTGVGPPNPNPNYLGLNYLDDIMAHEIGHALGIGILWEENGVYVPGTGQYLGEHGVCAYQAEFDPNATFVPVELAGLGGTADQHWNQLMRSSPQEGNPNDPYSLSPLTGITDAQGRDLGMELLTGALDPDYGEPFLSRTTVQSLRDLGYTVVPEPSGTLLMLTTWLTLGCRRRQ
jgi:hypothetical protein